MAHAGLARNVITGVMATPISLVIAGHMACRFIAEVITMMFMLMCKDCGHRSWHRLSINELDYGAHLVCQIHNCQCIKDVTAVVGPAIVRAYDAENEFRAPQLYGPNRES